MDFGIAEKVCQWFERARVGQAAQLARRRARHAVLPRQRAHQQIDGVVIAEAAQFHDGPVSLLRVAFGLQRAGEFPRLERFEHQTRSKTNFSSFTASAWKLRMPSAVFSVAMASSLSIHRNF